MSCFIEHNSLRHLEKLVVYETLTQKHSGNKVEMFWLIQSGKDILRFFSPHIKMFYAAINMLYVNNRFASPPLLPDISYQP